MAKWIEIVFRPVDFKGKIMRTLKKNIAAGVLGAILLAGVGGTFALWTAEDRAPIGIINTAELSASLDGAAYWTHEGIGLGPVSVTDLEAIRMMPGDSLRGEFTKAATIDTDGRPLVASFDFDLPDIDARAEGEGSNKVYRVYVGDEPTAFTLSVDGGTWGEEVTTFSTEFFVTINFEDTALSNRNNGVPAYFGDLRVTLRQVVPED